MMNDIDDLLDSAFYDYNEGHYEAAEQKARQALILSPSHGDCFYLLGLIAHKKGIFTQACDLLNLAVKAYPNQDNYRLALAEVYQYHGDYDKALKLYEPFVDNLKVQIQLGWIFIHQGKKEKAKKIFQSMLTGCCSSKAYHGLAFCFQNKEKLKYLKKSFEIEKSSNVAEDILCYFLSQKQAQKAAPYISFIKNDCLLARYWIDLKKYHLAEKILRPYVQGNYYDIEGVDLLAICLENLKNYQEAEKFYMQALSLDKNNFDAHKGLARTMMRQGKLSLALDHYQIVCQQYPEDKETLLAMAVIQEGLGEESEALGLFFRLLTLKAKGLDNKIKNCIKKLYQKDKKLAKKFATGWAKNYPQNKIAQKLLTSLGIFLLILMTIFPLQAEYFSDEQNWNLAWRNKMAEMGHAESQYELAQMFETGKGVPKNISQAIHYYQLSAAQNHFPSMLKLGEIFAQDNAYHDSDKSLQWYTYAAQKGEVQAQLFLADYYQKEILDKKQAKYWLEKALKQLFPDTTDFTKVSPAYQKLLQD